MGAVSELVGALAVLGIMRAYDTRKAELISRQEEAFVPFKLPPLSEQEHTQLTEGQCAPTSVHDKRLWKRQGEYPQEKTA